MARLQITLPPEDERRAHTRAAELGISLTEYVRRLVARDLDERQGMRDTGGLLDLGDSGGSDVAREKDRYADEAVEAAR